MEYIESLPNRYSYLLKKKSNFYDWFISSKVYVSNKKINKKQILYSLEILLEECESLRIKFKIFNEEIFEFIEEVYNVESYIDISCIDVIKIEDIENNIIYRINKYKGTLGGDKELFKLFITMDANEKVYIYFLVHHITCDLISYVMIKNRFFNLLEDPKIGEKISYKEYVEEVRKYWKNEKNLKDNIIFYWESFYLRKFDSLGEFDGQHLLEKNSEKLEIKLTDSIKEIINRISKRDLAISLLISYSRALYFWSNGKMKNNLIYLVYHGREYFDNKINSANLVGWLNQVFPFSIENSLPTEKLIEILRTQIYYMYANSSSYGILKYIVKLPLLVNIPEAQISINIALENREINLDDVAVANINIENKMNENSQRAFILSSGFYIRDGCYCFSIDFSNKIYSSVSINNLLTKFKSEFNNFLVDSYA